MKEEILVAERNTIKKVLRKGMLRIALVFPTTYIGAMAGYTLQLLYSYFNQHPDVICERAFLPLQIPSKGKSNFASGRSLPPIRTWESGSPLTDFDWIAFSIHYELDYPSVLWLLDNAMIPLRHSDRFSSNFVKDEIEHESTFPVMIAGGPALRANPLPISEYMDLIFIGEFENAWADSVRIWQKYLRLHTNWKSIQKDFTSNIIEIPGWWNPHLSSQSNTFNNLIQKPRRVWVSNLDYAYHPSQQVIPQFDPPEANPLVFGQTFYLEVNRGCPHGCHFCQTGQLSKPFRNRSLLILQNIVTKGIIENQLRHITLIGSSVTDHPDFGSLMQFIIQHGCTISIPSIRIDKITPNIAQLISQGGMRTVTFAPETGTNSLRQRMNKQLTNEQILNGCRILKDAKIPNFKLYFLYGLPFETEADAGAMVDLIRQIADFKFDKWGLRISLNPFIPKAGTPFERFIEHYRDPKMHWLQNQYNHIISPLQGDKRIKMESLPLEEAFLQTILSLGDRNASSIIDLGYKVELKYSKWYRSVYKNAQNWCSKLWTEIESRNFGQQQWDLIDQGCQSSFLAHQWQCAVEGKFGLHCNEGCIACGCCDKKE